MALLLGSTKGCHHAFGIVNATRFCLDAAHYIPFFSFKEELSFSIKGHDISCTDKECEYVAEISSLRLGAG